MVIFYILLVEENKYELEKKKIFVSLNRYYWETYFFVKKAEKLVGKSHFVFFFSTYFAVFFFSYTWNIGWYVESSGFRRFIFGETWTYVKTWVVKQTSKFTKKKLYFFLPLTISPIYVLFKLICAIESFYEKIFSSKNYFDVKCYKT